jgi:hypothetical protein
MSVKKWRERNYLFALIGIPFVLLGSLAVKPEGIRSTADILAIYFGLTFCFVQIVIWLVAIIRWIRTS